MLKRLMAVLFFLSLVVFISILMIKDDKYSKIQYKREKFIYEDFEKYTQELKNNYYILTNKIPQIIGDLIEGETKHLLLAGIISCKNTLSIGIVSPFFVFSQHLS